MSTKSIALGGLSAPKSLDTIGNPQTLHERWSSWKNELEIYLIASGVVNPEQKKAILLLTGGEGIRELYKNFTPQQHTDLEYSDNIQRNVFQVAMLLFDNHFALKENIPRARHNFFKTTPHPGETINNFITRLKSEIQYCKFKTENDDLVRDKVLLHVENEELLSRLFREGNHLTLDRLLEIITNYHHKEALILEPLSDTNRVSGKTPDNHDTTFGTNIKCYKCGLRGHHGEL